MDDDVAFAIQLTNLCQLFRCLPGPGGLMQQDSLYVHMMAAVLDAQAEKAEIERKRKSGP